MLNRINNVKKQYLQPLHCPQINDYSWIELFLLDRNTWNNLTVSEKMNSGSFKRVIYKMCLQITYIYLIYMYKEDLALNNLQWLICHKTQ